jgi:hypothetical protein
MTFKMSSAVSVTVSTTEAVMFNVVVPPEGLSNFRQGRRKAEEDL